MKIQLIDNAKKLEVNFEDKFPQFFKGATESGFSITECVQEKNEQGKVYYTVTLFDEYGGKYVHYISEDGYFDVDLIEYLG